jgi:hypothetical protein
VHSVGFDFYDFLECYLFEIERKEDSQLIFIFPYPTIIWRIFITVKFHNSEFISCLKGSDSKEKLYLGEFS